MEGKYSIQPAFEQRVRRHNERRSFDRVFFDSSITSNANVAAIENAVNQAVAQNLFRYFKQHFAQGQAFTYGLEDVGRYYADYVELMAHVDAVLPGRVHRVIYEEMVADTEAQVRALLAHCGLPFEDACLRFYENDRAVRTASSEQVRQPIFRDAADHWRRFEPWLDPLKASLGSVLDSYPEPPAYPA